MAGVSLQRAHEPLVLALDVGTSSVRGLVYDARGQAVQGAAARAPVPLHLTPDGGAAVDADGLVACTAEVVDRLARVAPAAVGTVRAVAACTFWHSLLGVDARGRAVTPLLLWLDARAYAQGEALRAALDERAVHARTGCVLHWSYWPAKLRWLAETQPETTPRVHRWLGFGEYLQLRLFGAAYATVSMASATGLLDQRTCDWDATVLAAVPVDSARLPPISDSPCSGLRAEYARRWPALRAVPWFPARGDGACSNVGCGCVTGERFALMIGTSGALRVTFRCPELAIPVGAWCYRVDRQRVVLGGALNDAGNLYVWALETLRLKPGRDLTAEVLAQAPDQHGLTVLPFLAGERSPGWAPRARGAILGLTLATRPVDLLRAAMEAVALRFALLAEILGPIVPGLPQIVATGGAVARSPGWLQIIADALGRPVTLSAEPEASSRGAALLALEALNAVSSVEAVPAALGPVYTPDGARHAAYRAALERQQQYYALLVAGESQAGAGAMPTHLGPDGCP